MKYELLDILVTVSGTYWDKKPQYSIWLDNLPIIQTEISSKDPQSHRFTHEVEEGEHSLVIRLENKTSADTKVQHGEIVEDMLLNVLNIEIDEISLGQLLWETEFVLDTPHEYQGNLITKLDRCVNLGWNGNYILKFTSPFYLWLLERL